MLEESPLLLSLNVYDIYKYVSSILFLSAIACHSEDTDFGIGDVSSYVPFEFV